MEPVVGGLLAAAVRSLAGWAENAFEDGKLSYPEWKQLGATMFRVGLLYAGALGLVSLSSDEVNVLATAGVAVLLDFGYYTFKKALGRKK